MRFLIFILFLSISITLNGQDRKCGTGLLHENEKKQPESESTISSLRLVENPVDGIINIPVVVHVIHSNLNGEIGGSNISKEQIESQISVLNEDFGRIQGTKGFNSDPLGADLEIRFCLAQQDTNGYPTNGIVRVYNIKRYWSIHDDEALKKLSYWRSDKYLNIWVANITPDNLLGWAQYPKDVPGVTGKDGAITDGVVIHYKAFGRIGDLIANYDLGRTATHEVGHWLGLLHLSGDGACGNDYVDDTPWDYRLNETSMCSDSSDCDGDGKFSSDMANNYLDYSYDRCMNIFTLGQKERVRNTFIINSRRNAILSSMGCDPPTGIVKKELNNVSLFPNPVTENLYINFQDINSGQAYLYNSINELVGSEAFYSSSNITLDLSYLNSGFYYLILDTDSGKSVHKVIRK